MGRSEEGESQYARHHAGRSARGGVAGAIDELERAVVRLGCQLEPLDQEQLGSTPPPSHLTPAYRRALWIVVGLNVG